MGDYIADRLDAVAADIARHPERLRGRPDGEALLTLHDPCDPTLEFEVRTNLQTAPDGKRRIFIDAWVPRGHRMIDLDEPTND